MRGKFSPAFSIVLVSALLGFSMGCSKRPSDDAIKKDIQDKVAADPDTKDSNVSVASKDGKVTLTGTAKNPAAQQKLEQIAKQEPGIAGVENQTTVQPPIEVPAGTDIVIILGQALSSKSEPSGADVFGDFGAAGVGGRSDGDPEGIERERESVDGQVERQD